MTDDERALVAFVNAMSQEEREALRDLLREIVESQGTKQVPLHVERGGAGAT